MKAQPFQTVHHFGGSLISGGVDGYSPLGGLVLSGEAFYGSTWLGGDGLTGAIYKLNTNGDGYQVVKNLAALDALPPLIPYNTEGAEPVGTFLADGATLYGVASGGGLMNDGTVFKVNLDGTGFTVLRDFDGSDGALPFAGLVLGNGVLYGTASSGGAANVGNIFKVDTNGANFAVLKEFSATAGSAEGNTPYASLILSGGVLYGTSYGGGSAGFGTVFKINTDGSGFTTLKDFQGNDGQAPLAGLVLADDALYGTTSLGGKGDAGTVFKLNTNGGDFQVVWHFSALFTNQSGVATNFDGAWPGAELVLSNDTIYGTAAGGGSSGNGMVFMVQTNGAGFFRLKDFAGSDGRLPYSALLLHDHALWGTTLQGGMSNLGTIFKVGLDPLITGQAVRAKVEYGDSASFSVVVAGTEPFGFQWRKDGTDLVAGAQIQGVTNAALTLSNITFADAGSYSVVVSNANGFVVSDAANLVVQPLPEVGVAVNAPDWSWTSGGAMPWVYDKSTNHDGVASARSGIVVSNQSSWLQTTVSGPGTLSFWWQGSLFAGDALMFQYDTNKVVWSETNCTGCYAFMPWKRQTFQLASGTHTLRWTSTNLAGRASGPGRVWLDQVEWVSSLATMQVFIFGKGKLTPDYNSQSLELGKTYTMTPSPSPGFVLSEWYSVTNGIDWVVSRASPITFVMRSNLMIVANFVDVTRPTMNLTSPIANQRWSNDVFVVKGTATDNDQVQEVRCQLNGEEWQVAGTTNGWINWAASVRLKPGNNLLRAYAVDVQGNCSITNTVNFIYVVSDVLRAATNGPGNLSPNYNHQWLEIGKSYSMTASPSKVGYAFASWTWTTNGNDFITNAPPLTFVMRSNLSLVANFNDVTKPTLLITQPALNQRWTNELFTAQGRTTDNGQVQQVRFQLNAAAWQPAATTNGWTNWFADLALQPGTNVLRAFSMDAYGNCSLTGSVSLFFVVPAQINVATNGRGSLSPNYHGQFLEIGRSYTMTALAGPGFVLTNWSSDPGFSAGVVTNKPALTFQMCSNLSLTATFVDVQRPTLTVTQPVVNQRTTNDFFTAQGRTTDNGQIKEVQYQLNGGDWLPAVTTNNWVTWSAGVTLLPGTNVIRAFSTDAYGNNSLTGSVSLFFVVPSQITVLTNGRGVVSPNYHGQFLEIGRNYTMAATPGIGFVFSNWIGGFTQRAPKITFLMQSNLLLQANFITNPFAPAKGTYNGLFYETNGVANGSSGYFTALTTDQGSYSGSLSLAGRTYPFTGQFYVDGSASNAVARPGTNALALDLHWDLAGGKLMVGSASDRTWTAELVANRATFNVLTNPAPQAGRYTVLFPGGDGAPTHPGGDAYGNVTVSTAGQIVFTGRLDDGTAISQVTTLSDDGQWPLYQTLYAGKGSLLGWLSFSNQPDSDIAGKVSWLKLPQLVKYYPAGFDHETEIAGSRYLPPPLNTRVLDLEYGRAWFANGNLPLNFTNLVRLNSNNLVQNLSSNQLSLYLSTASGTFSGSATDPVSRKVISFQGVLLQKQNRGGGYFLGTNQTGRVRFEP